MTKDYQQGVRDMYDMANKALNAQLSFEMIKGLVEKSYEMLLEEAEKREAYRKERILVQRLPDEGIITFLLRVFKEHHPNRIYAPPQGFVDYYEALTLGEKETITSTKLIFRGKDVIMHTKSDWEVEL